MTSRFILASASPRRHELLRAFQFDFEIIKPQIDESQHAGEAPYDYVCRLSAEKAQAIAKHLTTPATILSADTIVVLSADTIGVTENDRILGKPTNAEDARQTLCALRDRPHVVATSVTLLKWTPDDDTQIVTEVEKTRVHMRPYSDDEIETYIASGDPFDKAGSYAIQNTEFAPVARLEGCYYNVVGLPMCIVWRGLQTIGWANYHTPTNLRACTFNECPFRGED